MSVRQRLKCLFGRHAYRHWARYSNIPGQLIMVPAGLKSWPWHLITSADVCMGCADVQNVTWQYPAPGGMQGEAS